MVEPLTDIERVLVVTAHPDDVDFGAAGTVAAWTDAGVDVAYVVATDGRTGGYDPDVDRAHMGQLRKTEQRAAAEAVGVREVRFLDLVDGEVEVTLDLRRQVARQVRLWRPDVVVTMSPERDWDRLAGPAHPDHLAVGEATVRAIYPDARNPFAFPELLADEGLEPHVVRQLWLFAGPCADHVVDITTTADRKFAALRCHRTQLPDPDGLEAQLREDLRERAREAGLGPDRLAERFRVVASA